MCENENLSLIYLCEVKIRRTGDEFGASVLPQILLYLMMMGHYLAILKLYSFKLLETLFFFPRHLLKVGMEGKLMKLLKERFDGIASTSCL